LLAKIFRANEKLAAQQSINLHIIRGLEYAIDWEKKKRQRGKRLNLIDEASEGPIFWSPTKVRAAKAIIDEKEASDAKAKEDSAINKANKALEKEKKAAIQQEKALQRSIRQEEAQKEKARKVVERERKAADRQEKAIAKKAEKEARKADEVAKKALQIASKPLKASMKADKGKQKLVESSIEVVNTLVAKKVVSRTTTGRAVIDNTCTFHSVALIFYSNLV
jgi:hypothetical protein